MHPFVTNLLYVAAHDSVALDWLVQEFEFNENELDEFVSWVKLRNFAILSVTSDEEPDEEPNLRITPEGTKWVLKQLWDFASNEYADDI